MNKDILFDITLALILGWLGFLILIFTGDCGLNTNGSSWPPDERDPISASLDL